MLTWSQLLGLLEAGNYTELTIGEAPYLDYLLNINIDRFHFPESTPGRIMAATTPETKSVSIYVKEVIQIRGFT